MNLRHTFEFGMHRSLPDFIEPTIYGVQLNLGCGNKRIDNCDNLDLPNWDYHTGLDYADETVSIIHAYHFLEHVDDPIWMLRECERVLKMSGVMNIVVPYYTSSMQAQDLDHKACFCETTWKTLFENEHYAKHGKWKFRVGCNVIMGLVERNLALVTQLIKE